MKITKRQLKRIIKEEYSRIHRKRLLREAQAQEVNESLKDLMGTISGWAKTGKTMMSDASGFVDGVKLFLQDNQDWIEPLYNMIKDMRNSGKIKDTSGEMFDPGEYLD